MKIKNVSIYLLLGLTAFMFNACEKDDMDKNTATPTTPEVNCDDLQVVIEANPDLNAVVNNGVPPYTYLWSTGDTTENLLPNGIGTYSLTVTDDEGCTGTNSFELKTYDPCDFISGSFGGTSNSGMASLEIFNGTPPYTYYWSTGDTSQTIISPQEGYAGAVYDANACGFAYFLDLNPCLSLSVQIEENPSGTLTANTNSLTEAYPYIPYTYLWSTGETTKTITTTMSGNYSVTVTDVFNCSTEDEIDL